MSSKELKRDFDALFAKYANLLPVSFLRALGQKESGLNPALDGGAPAVGLLQVVPVLMKEHNQLTGESIKRADLLNADKNVQIATGLLNRIIAYYKRLCPESPNLQKDWTNPEFVKLLVCGWNAGYSASGGVVKVAKHLERKGLAVTHDNVIAHARAAGAVKWLWSDADLKAAGENLKSRRGWQASVAALFYKQPDAPKSEGGGAADKGDATDPASAEYWKKLDLTKGAAGVPTKDKGAANVATLGLVAILALGIGGYLFLK